MKRLIEKIKEQKQKKFNKKYGSVFKEKTEELFKNLEYTVQNVEYLDGYFIFNFGENSVVHFKLKECPGWLFAIWWKVEKKKISGIFFTQYEIDIDKFKPTTSVIKHDVNIGDYYEINATLRFIHDEPELAWYRSLNMLDFNTTHVTRKKAKFDYKKHVEYHYKSIAVEKEYNDAMIKYAIENFAPLYNKLKIIDRGENVLPRFMICVNVDGLEKGYFYDIFETKKAKEIFNEFDKNLKKHLEEKYNDKFYFWNTYSLDVFNLRDELYPEFGTDEDEKIIYEKGE